MDIKTFAKQLQELMPDFKIVENDVKKKIEICKDGKIINSVRYPIIEFMSDALVESGIMEDLKQKIVELCEHKVSSIGKESKQKGIVKEETAGFCVMCECKILKGEGRYFTQNGPLCVQCKNGLGEDGI